ncbi:class I SAM-dependent DNA methyltransferase [Streptomyces sp. NBC_01498]|uniref:class I SAM-dependent DNA methyltransferase n=1 Tax=Streptomyces sp. NBC_01498 TaxID=2975870 RepID=UPI002E7C1585|nr:class I SAM-dependent methyltransferase [Streptomyces sp. NBC_01498]
MTATEPDFIRDTRAGYDAIAADYAELVRSAPEHDPLGRAMLGTFAEYVRTDGGGPVVEIGSGPGQMTAHLHTLGLDISGIDLSPVMVAMARRTYPELRFEEGSMTGLALPDGALAGLVAWYSIIHIVPERLPDVFAQFHRVLAPGGRLLLAFQVGDEPRHYDEAFGHPVNLDFRRLSPDRVLDLLERAGFRPTARLLREPYETDPTPHALVLARKPLPEPGTQGLSSGSRRARVPRHHASPPLTAPEGGTASAVPPSSAVRSTAPPWHRPLTRRALTDPA